MKTYTTFGAVLLTAFALLQGLRFLLGWPVLINGFAVPLWFSAVAFLVVGWVAIGLWRERERGRA